jgi:hypothetical protein
MAKDSIPSSILGDINPKPGTEEHVKSKVESGSEEDDTLIIGGSRDDSNQPSGSREITGSVVGGTQAGGTRNYRQGSGHTGGDIGNRVE